MREKLLSLPLAELREIARAKGIKNIAATRKSALVDKLVALAEEEQAQESAEEYVPAAETKEATPAREKKENTSRENRPAKRSTRGSETREKEIHRKKESEENSGQRGRESNPEGLVRPANMRSEEMAALDSGVPADGILEVMPEGFGFIRCENYLPGENDVYVSPSQIRRFNMKTGDIVYGSKRIKTGQEKFAALLYVNKINDMPADEAVKRPNFEDLTPVFPNSRLHLETAGAGVAMRIVDLLSPIGKGQRGMIVSPPKAGKTTLLKQIARSIVRNHPEMHVIILLIDERPEEVTDIKESIEGPNAEVIYSTFDGGV